MILNSELRQDPVSGDWIVMAPSRSKRPHDLIKKPAKRQRASKIGCPFEDPQKSGNPEPYLIYPDKAHWQLQVLENKYPAIRHQKTCGLLVKKGPFSVFPPTGHHDLIITRDHNKNFPRLSPADALMVFQAFQDRYLMIFNDSCLSYISFFHNWGPTAGASVYHPHYQMIALPVVPPDVQHSLGGSSAYFKKNRSCVHCDMLDWERRERKRVIYENAGAVAFAPFVSRNSFEVRIFPKKHLPFFENSLDQDIEAVVEALRLILKSVEKNLGDPDYNFFLHTAPIKDKEQYQHYHWHIEIYPKVTIRAGFELGTGVDINQIDPDEAAKLLRSKS